MQNNTGFCKHCKKQVLVVKEERNNVLHLFLSIVTCGIWLIIWLILLFDQGGLIGRKWRCSVCGRKVEQVGNRKNSFFYSTLIGGMFFIAIMTLFSNGSSEKNTKEANADVIENKIDTSPIAKISIDDIKNKCPKEKLIMDLLYNDDLYITTISNNSETLLWEYIKQNYPHFAIATLAEIINIYNENALKGDKLYKNKPTILFGQIGQIRRNSFNDNPYIIFPLGYGFSHARAEFKNWQLEADQISNLHTGETVSLVCQNTEYKSNTIFFFDCEFFENFINREVKPSFYEMIYRGLINPIQENAGIAYMITYFSEQFTSTQIDECLRSKERCNKKIETIGTKILNLKKKGFNYMPKRYLELGFTKEMLKEKR